MSDFAALTTAMDNKIHLEKMSLYLSHISKKNKKEPVVLFFGRSAFSDNSKYLYLNFVKESKIKPVWCSMNNSLVEKLRAHGLPAFDLMADISETLKLLLSASVAVHSVNPLESLDAEIFLNALSGAKHIQLWHGVGAKRLDLGLINKVDMLNIHQVQSLHWASSVDIVVSPGERHDSLWHESFGVTDILRAGLPRNEVLLREATAFERIDSVSSDIIDRHNGLKILWAPTFSKDSRLSAWRRLDLIDALLKGAGDHHPHLFIKPHPYEPISDQEEENLRGKATILPKCDDIYPALKSFDLLITDRSSLLSDFLWLDKPVLLLDDHHKTEPESDIVYDAPAPGMSCDYADAEAAIRALLRHDHYRAARAANRQAIFESSALTACQDIRLVIEELVSTAQTPKLTVRTPQHYCAAQPRQRFLKEA